MRSIRRKLALALVVWAVLFAVGEIAARIYVGVRAQDAPKDGERDLYLSDTNKPTPLFRPHPYLAYESDPEHPEHNTQGFRGPREHDPAFQGLRIACVGGSTKVSEPQSFPRQLEQVLAAEVEGPIDVVNAGVSGYSTFNLIGHLALRVVPLKPDICVFYVGWNDAWNRLLHANARADNTHAQRAWQGSVERPFWRRSVLLDRIAGRLGHPYPPSIHKLCWHPRSGDARANWEASDFDSFRANLRTLIAICKAHRIQPVFCAQATDFEHYPVGLGDGVFAEAMDATTHEVKSLKGPFTLSATVIDLRMPMSNQADYFADTVHMTAAGNKERARLVAKRLVSDGSVLTVPRKR